MLKFLFIILSIVFIKPTLANENEVTYSYIVDDSNQKLTCLVIHYNHIDSQGYLYNGFITVSNQNKVSCEPKDIITGTFVFSVSNLTTQQKQDLLDIINEGNLAKNNGFEIID